MAQADAPKQQKTKAQAREDRLKVALKANMARRKAQTRARIAPDKNKKGSEGASEEGS